MDSRFRVAWLSGNFAANPLEGGEGVANGLRASTLFRVSNYASPKTLVIVVAAGAQTFRPFSEVSFLVLSIQSQLAPSEECEKGGGGGGESDLRIVPLSSVIVLFLVWERGNVRIGGEGCDGSCFILY